MKETETQLISKGITKRDNGQYQWYECEWLMVHEAFRREILRAERALNNINIVIHKWHIANLYQWMNQYLLPCLFNQLKTTVDVIVPFYESKGEESIDIQKAQVVLLLMNNVEEKVKELYHSVYQPVNIHQALTSQDLLEKVAEIKRLFSIFKTYIFVYMDEQDKLWSNVYHKYGVAALTHLTEAIYEDSTNHSIYKTKQDKKLFKLFLASILDYGGYQTPKFNQMTLSVLQPPTFPIKVNLSEIEIFLPWCNLSYIHQVYSQLPIYTRMFEMPGIFKEYHSKWKVMIESINYDYDCLHLIN